MYATVSFKLKRPTILKKRPKNKKKDKKGGHHSVPFLAFLPFRSGRDGKALIVVQFCRDVISKAVSHPAIRKMADILRAETKNTTCTVNTLKEALRLASLVLIAKCKLHTYIFFIEFFKM